ncbi:hypothetical protein [Phaeodactylibacter xiamenensis]|uniref:hypothetical protein n=1 Tax=Phaeodactylibacter xiamenensis TaxID=1524460 RepID=UPI0024A9987D|nr:hypothetical protein [Phaeodactylibacter xiamenensis]
MIVLLLTLVVAGCDKEEYALPVEANGKSLEESTKGSTLYLNHDVTAFDEKLIIYGRDVYLKDGRLIFKSIADADHIRSSIINDGTKQSILEELKGFTSSKSAFMTATKELSEAAVFTGIDAYSNIGVLIDDSGEVSYEKVVDDPGLQYMANQEALFQIAGDIYKIYRDFALVVPEDTFFTQSESQLLNNETFQRIPIFRPGSNARADIHTCSSEWREDGSRRKRRRVKGELEHRTNIFTGNLTGNVRTKGQRRRFGIWWQYRMDIIRHEGSISVLELGGASTVVNIFKEEENDDEIVTEVFQCEDCIGFCGSFSIEHYAYRGDPATESGTCYTQPPLQGPCI